MSLSLEDNHSDLIRKLETLIQQRNEASEAILIQSFLAQYYLGVSSYDLKEKSLEELYGALISLWHLIYERKPGESKVKVYNPVLEQNGWQSVHTIIEIIHENKPFLLDSIRLSLNKQDLNVRLIIHAEGIRFKRDENGTIQKIIEFDEHEKYSKSKNLPVPETPIYIEIDRQSNIDKLDTIAKEICKVLDDVDVMVEDWNKMLCCLTESISVLEAVAEKKPKQNLQEVIRFLHWLADNNFTFIGVAEYNFVRDGDVSFKMEYIPGTGLGVESEDKPFTRTFRFQDLYPAAREEILNDNILLLGKTDTPSTVHRPAYTDFVAIKSFDAQGRLVKLIRFVGLYTSVVYNVSVDSIPFIRKKIASVFEMTGFPKSSHDGKTLMHIIETLPRDEIFQARAKELFDFSTGILHLQERQKIRLFMRRDVYGRYFSCLVYVPREIFSSQLRNKMQEILMNVLNGQSITFETKFSESILARIYFIIRVKQTEDIMFDQDAIESKLIASARVWSDDLLDSLIEYFGEETANIMFKKYVNAFPISYRELFSAKVAVVDIKHMENIYNLDDDSLEMTLYRTLEDTDSVFRFKLFRVNKTIPLSDVVPILEKMGLRIISERPHEIRISNQTVIWISDYKMLHPKAENMAPEKVSTMFQEAFAAVWNNYAENDGLNRLVLNADISWRDISILRAYYKYMWQTGLVFSQSSVEDTLSNNTSIATDLLRYLYTKFDPDLNVKDRQASLDTIKLDIESALEAVTSLNEDRVIRSYLGAITATVRTNYFQTKQDGSFKDYISFKLDSSEVPDLPLPKPMYEIFIYNTQVEGLHLRADKIARGGLRWSDRPEDFRTEILGLMKAQQVKNAVIVPLGAKGGFIVKTDMQNISSREERNKIVIQSYKTFIRGLLDITDNFQNSQIISPDKCICWDENDAYLVVAADKGTASFSDIANSISKEYNFWLGDAFASGGSTGYDHKKMAITARGAWESVKIHFQQLDQDIKTKSFTVIGVGDMAGDVFGNGMLMSNKMKLIAAFNHMHIFFDPDPDPAISYAERKRLFDLPVSTWADYNQQSISKGGGIFLRSAKKIPISSQMKKWLNISDNFLEPNKLVRKILMLKVDLFYNGGIGTFVKSKLERTADVGDRINDAIRVNGDELNAQVVCEGGNLGFTQLARIEFAKKGGLINTDAIDNSGGVNCSDNEVNIKILLDGLVIAEDLTEKQRNLLLESMTNEVASLVLENNRKQNEALTLAAFQSQNNVYMHNGLLRELERNAGLDPAVEYLPDGEEIALRISAKQGFTRPELAVLMAYTKIHIKKQLLISNIPDEPFVVHDLIQYFPKPLHEAKFLPFMNTHGLRRDIIATQISNYIVNEMGINFMQRLAEESGVDIAQLARAYLIAREVFDVQQVQTEIRSLDNIVSMQLQINMWLDLNRLVRRATRWFARNIRGNIDIEQCINTYKPKVSIVAKNIYNVMRGTTLEQVNLHSYNLIESGVNESLAKKVAMFYSMFTALDIVQANIEYGYDLLDVCEIYFELGTQLDLVWLGELIKKQPVHSYWEALARAVFRDDIEKQQRNLSISIIKNNEQKHKSVSERVECWMNAHAELLSRWDFLISELKTSEPSFTMFAIAIREMLDVSREVKRPVFKEQGG